VAGSEIGCNESFERRRHIRQCADGTIYGTWLTAKIPGSALRNAKLDLLSEYGDQVKPILLAAFIAVGETSTPISMRQQ